MTLERLVCRIEEISREAPPKRSIVDFVDELWVNYAGLDSRTAPGLVPLDCLDAVIVTAAGSDRPWLGGAAAMQGAVHHLLSSAPHSLEREKGEVVAFCASEIGGNRPMAIETSLVNDPAGNGYVSTGTKRWATLGPVASHLLVIVSEGIDEGRNHLRAVLIPADRAGVFVEEMTIPGNVQANLRLPHSLINLEQVKVYDGELLPGDGYTAYLKPFRTIEDLYGCCARASALLALAFRHEAPAAEIEGLVALLAGLRAVVGEDISAASSHLVVGAAESSLPALGRDVVARLPPETASWWVSDGEVEVAGSAKEARRQRALERILGSAD